MPAPNRFVTARLSLRKGTSKEWEDSDPVLMLGEPAYDTTTNKFKIGDGESKWGKLPYVQNLGGEGMWQNDSSGLYPEWVTSQQDAVDYVMFRLDQLEGNANAYFDAGIDGLPNVTLFTLNISSGTGGFASIDGAPRKWNTYEDGTSVPITATPLANYQFQKWEGDNITDPNSGKTTIVMAKDQSVNAVFIKL